jgi:hypothetical protein
MIESSNRMAVSYEGKYHGHGRPCNGPARFASCAKTGKASCFALREVIMSQSLMSRDKLEAKKKGLFALSAWTGAGILFLFYHSALLGLLTVGGAVYLTYRWFMFRAKRGMRF